MSTYLQGRYSLDGIGAIAVSNDLGLVVGVLVDRELEGLALGGRLDESAFELDGGADDGL